MICKKLTLINIRKPNQYIYEVIILDGFETKKEEAWNNFYKSGKINDFLTYNSIAKGEIYEYDKNKGNSDFGNKTW